MFSNKVQENISDLAFLQKVGIKDEEKHEETLKMMDEEISNQLLIAEMEEIMDNAEVWDREYGYED